ncbi:LOW QUALITY PROTEIN: macrosialin [Emydura macquarii macquarii]|uniref:LOW QUALITY PROTEIN: macrosialin n=1 Tax=Emydura macquarii macquarii TaxID=1129001 RepID=UPI00352A8B21
MSPLGSLCLLLLAAVCVSSSPGDGAPEPTGGSEPGFRGPTPGMQAPCDGCPRHRKSATLEPAFTRTTTASTTTTHRTTPPTNHTTGHPTTPRPTNHTTGHPTTPVPPITPQGAPPITLRGTPQPPTPPSTPPVTPHPHPTNHTTPPRPTPPHPTKHTTGHTTHPHPTNHTTPPRPTPPHPTKHTTPPHTTPPHTTVAPLVAVGDYRVLNGSDVCLRVQAGLQIRVEYTNSSKAQLWGAFAVQPNHTVASGNCSSDAAILELRFPQGFLLFTFLKNMTRKTFYLGGVRANLSLRFPGAMEHSFTVQSHNLREFEASLGRSYQCENQSLALGPAFRLDALHERVQAFALRGGAFGAADLCPQQRSSLVPLIIGVVLLVLIIIIIIAYLLGRQRTRGGYQTL